MKGNIYTRQRCWVCGGKLTHDENRNGLFCAKHPEVSATTGFYVKFGREVNIRFKTFALAYQFLVGLRFKDTEGTFDSRDYKATAPLGFENQVNKFLAIKKNTMKPGSHRILSIDMNRAVTAWGQRNVKTISYGDFEDLFASLSHLSSKSVHNQRSNLSQFFKWLNKREGIPVPEIPKVQFELGWREIIDIGTQTRIIDEVQRISWDIDPKIWMGIRWLATYVAIRPVELIQLRERDVNVNGMLVCRPSTTKDKTPKLVPMLQEDITMVESMPKGLPDLLFFRHAKTRGTAIAGQQFGHRLLYSWWKKACKNLGIEGVDLYGGTRHSTATALREQYSHEELKQHGTMHKTDKAFDRYVQGEVKPSRSIYESARNLGKDQQEKQGQVIKFQKQ